MRLFPPLIPFLVYGSLVFSLPLNSPLLDSYDYIRGGPAGLTLANRLSEDADTTVLLLEAGPADDGDEPCIDIPALQGSAVSTRYDWNLSTVPQVYLDGKTRSLAQGHALGGGTLLNGLLWNRGSRADYEDWVKLGNPGWGWDDLLPYFKKSETCTPTTDAELASTFSIGYNSSVHGSSGPVNVSFPNYIWNSSALFFKGLNELGIPTTDDPNDGQGVGASFLPLTIDPIQETRSTARTAEYDPISSRSNLWVSTGQRVRKVIFANASLPDSFTKSHDEADMRPFFTDVTREAGAGCPRTKFSWLKKMLNEQIQTNLSRWSTESSVDRSRSLRRAVGVSFASSADSDPIIVLAAREVIISAGAIHSPQLLMLSGIGSKSELEPRGVDVLHDLPGVGKNLQDHGQTWCWYPYNNPSFLNVADLASNETFAAKAWGEYATSRTGPLSTTPFDGVGFIALPIVTDRTSSISADAILQPPAQYLPLGSDPTVIAGFAKQLPMLAAALNSSQRASYEILNANDGVLSIANMRPLSRGIVALNSSQPFDDPMIDPRYGSNPVDFEVYRNGIRFNERLIKTESLSVLQPLQTMPPQNSTDAELDGYIRTKLTTEYHPAGTCAMMPLELGGVVDANLMVYGTSNLRVVDASIIPILPAAHLQAVVYAIAEKAADLIKAHHARAQASTNAETSVQSKVQASGSAKDSREETKSAFSALSSSRIGSGHRVPTTFSTVTVTVTQMV